MLVAREPPAAMVGASKNDVESWPDLLASKFNKNQLTFDQPSKKWFEDDDGFALTLRPLLLKLQFLFHPALIQIT